MENRVINAAILGAGTVGGGVYKLAQAMEEDIFHKTGARLVIKKMLVRNVNKERKGIPSEILTDDWNSIISDPEIDVFSCNHSTLLPAVDKIAFQVRQDEPSVAK